MLPWMPSGVYGRRDRSHGLIISSGMVMQLLAGSMFIDVVQSSKKDRALLQSAQVLFGSLFFIGGMSGGLDGGLRELGAVYAFLVSQLFFAGVVVIILDKLLQEGYGLGSGISLFISWFFAAYICESIVGEVFSQTIMYTSRSAGVDKAFLHFCQLFYAGVVVILLGELLQEGYGLGLRIPLFISLFMNNGRGTEFEGAVVDTSHFLASKSDLMFVLRFSLEQVFALSTLSVRSCLFGCAGRDPLVAVSSTLFKVRC